MKEVYLGLGSNLGDREGNLREALTLLTGTGVRVLRTSSLYETEPMYVRQQPAFLNLVAHAETSLFPRQLLGRVQHVERALGRKRVVENGPRTIDVDVLLYGTAVLQLPELAVPHPRMAERRFVLEPLAELAPELRHPVTRRTIREMLAEVQGQGVTRLAGEGLPAGRRDAS